MLNKVCDFINQNNMISKGDRIVVGVSGGADSICLLYVLQRLRKVMGISLYAVHVNHGIRGSEADGDEQFVKELCKSLEVEFIAYHFNIKEMAKLKGLTEEEAGRNARYQAFLEVCKKLKCNKIAVAHNKNDNAETILFHLFRGTGIKGLIGIEPHRVISEDFGDIILIRPLLSTDRNEIEEFLMKEQVSFRTDSTNLTEDYSRNKIRNKILSYAKDEINSNAIGNINETALKLREVWDYINENLQMRYKYLVHEDKGFFAILVKELMKEPPVMQKGVLRMILNKLSGSLKDLEAKHVDAILSLCEKQVGRYVHLPYGIIAERGYEDIRIFIGRETKEQAEEQKPFEPVQMTIPGRVVIPQIRKVFEAKIIKHEKNKEIPKSSCMKWFDYDKIENAVDIRTRKEGDYIQINSSGGCKKLKDYFIDQKIPRNLRDCQILVADGSHIIWIPGSRDRISEKYKVDDSTENVLLMKMFNLEEMENDR